MREWFISITSFEKVFWYFAIPFSVVFIIQTILAFLGIGFEGDVDGDLDSSGDFADGGGFPIFTVRNFIIFFTVFGWTGITSINSGVSNGVTLILAIGLGLVVMFIVGGIFYFMANMTESGNVNINNAINKVGEVYLTIPMKRSGTGKVQIIIQGTVREIDAITDDEMIKSGEKVKVVDVIENTVLLVKRINK